MKPIFRIVAALMLLGIVSLIGLASLRLATRPKAIEWPKHQIRSKITKGMPRSTVLELLGPPHNPGETDHYFYINSYRSRGARHLSETPSNFAIFFKDEKVESILSAYDY
ncbi:MAG: outer membrane protein assembly factor BamE [Prosthecobacter sp.]|nr:outer membrane protein assembly factor BamE [Prosthecobacter sp.]